MLRIGILRSRAIFLIVFLASCAAFLFISKDTIAQNRGVVKTFQTLDTIRYLYFTKDIRLKQYLQKGNKIVNLFHPNDALLLGKVNDIFKDSNNAKEFIFKSICLGNVKEFLRNDSFFVRYNARYAHQIDSCFEVERIFRLENAIMTDSCMYFLTNDVKLFGDGINSSSYLLTRYKHLIDTSIKSHQDLQLILGGFIIRNGWLGFKKLHKSLLLLPVAHMSLENINSILDKLYYCAETGDMLPEELGFILEKRYQLQPHKKTSDCIYALEEFNCKLGWNDTIKQNRRAIGMSVFFLSDPHNFRLGGIESMELSKY